jgi:hypothetical protein
MKYTTEITINLPRERVIELFDDPVNLVKWQPGLKSFEAVSGTPGQPGAKSKLVYDMNGRVVEMIETITSRNLPNEFSGVYEANGVWNGMQNFFHDEGQNTRWVTETEFKFSGFMSLIGLLMPGSFKKETLKQMEQFKTFVEHA